MQFDLDRRVVYTDHAKHPGLTPWCLREFAADGEQIGGDMVPWHYSLYFHATSLSVVSSVSMVSDYANEAEPGCKIFACKDVIIASLVPEDTFGRGGRHNPVFSMFGTDRAIEKFSLRIEPLQSAEESERGLVWGIPQHRYEADITFHPTEPDVMEFHLYVVRERFERLVDRISRHDFEKAMIRVSNVRGCYARWTPEIVADKVKVLTQYDEHAVEMPEDAERNPLRLGEIDDLTVDFMSVSDLMPLRSGSTDPGDPEEEMLPPFIARPVDGPIGGSTKDRVLAIVSSVRIAAWVIVVLLLVLILK